MDKGSLILGYLCSPQGMLNVLGFCGQLSSPALWEIPEVLCILGVHSLWRLRSDKHELESCSVTSELFIHKYFRINHTTSSQDVAVN